MTDVVHYQDFDELLRLMDKSPVKYNKRKIKKAYAFANIPRPPSTTSRQISAKTSPSWSTV